MVNVGRPGPIHSRRDSACLVLTPSDAGKPASALGILGAAASAGSSTTTRSSIWRADACCPRANHDPVATRASVRPFLAGRLRRIDAWRGPPLAPAGLFALRRDHALAFDAAFRPPPATAAARLRFGRYLPDVVEVLPAPGR